MKRINSLKYAKYKSEININKHKILCKTAFFDRATKNILSIFIKKSYINGSLYKIRNFFYINS